jgi:hypothetical protein
LDGVPGIGTLEAREPNVATLFEPTKEVGEGAVKTFEFPKGRMWVS